MTPTLTVRSGYPTVWSPRSLLGLFCRQDDREGLIVRDTRRWSVSLAGQSGRIGGMRKVWPLVVGLGALLSVSCGDDEPAPTSTPTVVPIAAAPTSAPAVRVSAEPTSTPTARPKPIATAEGAQATDASVEDAHAHLMLRSYPSTVIDEAQVESHENELLAGVLSNSHPLSPCPLLAAAYIAFSLNEYWGQIINGPIPIPPPGSSMVGMFDQEIADGNVPRNDPTAAAEIIARLFMWQSGGVDGMANVFIDGLSPQACLEMLDSPPQLNARLENIEPPPMHQSHLPATTFYSGYLPREDSERFLRELRAVSFMALSSTATNNPLAPCSLLAAKRLASYLNVVWSDLMASPIPPPEDPLTDENLVIYESAFASRHFASAIIDRNESTRLLISKSTQQECLNEIFEPGLIRKSLEN